MKVFITGASSGLGAALACHYAARGATLGLVARRKDRLDALVRSLPGQHHVYALDVTDIEAMREAGRVFMDHAGVPDIVIANAGVSVGTLTEASEDMAAFRRVFETNVLGMVHTFQPFITALRMAGCGRLVGIGSVAGVRGLPGAAAYSASKAAMASCLESLRVELTGTGVKVIVIAPGYIETPMTEANPYPMPFLIKADDAARRIAQVIHTGKRYAVIPWQMAVVSKILRILPDALFDFLASRAGRKPRGALL